MPLGAAPMAYLLWHRIMRHHPANPQWLNRDRFILSAGHGSALLYGLLHLSGYDLGLDELRRFRQWESRTPGHPEYGVTPGVEATTGPLGQGFAMGVGMALAERHLAQQFNQEGYAPLVDHYTYAIVSDGDLMEGITAEAASLAGHLGLGKLIYLYDDNQISIEGSTDLTFTEDVAARFAAYRWQVLRVEDGENLEAIEAAIRQAQADGEHPSLIMVRTHIGFGSPRADSAAAHGSPLGKEALQATRRHFQWPDTSFHIPDGVYDHFRTIVSRGEAAEQQWHNLLQEMQRNFPPLSERFLQQMAGVLPANWQQDLSLLSRDGKAKATRVVSGEVLNALAPHLPALLGGSADLAPSNNTWLKNQPERNIHFGVREHAMAAISNGMALHGGIIPYCGTFLVFSDYMRGAIRLSALMGCHTIYVLTHDSIAVGEDGPTHQPIEHLASLRAIPGLLVFRPADAFETIAAWRLAIALQRPAALILTRQNLPLLPEQTASQGVAMGAYLLVDCPEEPQLTLLASGSEIHLALAAHHALREEGISRVRVVSMPSWELFTQQSAAYQRQILGPAHPRLAIEAGSSMGWHRWTGDQGAVLAIDHFGASAPGAELLQQFGFSVEQVLQTARALLNPSA
ncbi:transketolase [Candidatus Magnetaquicoccus inordinatus]|uniref:transketolase n=1 Tax=Candidatus Magnetaquicoccus inordinatus TaxID=2496818 RepID=UPI001D0DF7FB|nr:transketolase [Candidatus Magnetaquicoccus inordinatus]